ncbi:MAG: SAM-dependent DNA methyltransferase, partial [Nostoc sp.]
EYLQMGVENGISDRYLCRHRSPWYSQENRPPSPFLCTYMGRQDTKRGRPFRFILNNSQATATNVYLMLYPKPVLTQALSQNPEKIKQVWQALNEISDEMLMGEGRVYGGGLYKLEPKELG